MSTFQNDIIAEDLRDRMGALARGLTPAVIDEFNGLIGTWQLDEATGLVERLEREYSEWPDTPTYHIKVTGRSTTNKVLVRQI